MRTLSRLVVRNLLYHWRGNLAVLLGIAVGSAVLTGALLVGDSLRGSLRARAERQLAGVDAAATFPMPVQAALADGMPGNVAPVLMLPGSVQAGETRSLGRVNVLGIDERSTERFGIPAGVVDWRGDQPQIVLSQRVADRLGAKPGDRVRVGVERFSDMPRSSSFARRSAEDVTTTRTFTVAAVLPPDAPGNDFNLIPNPAAPLNVFVPLAALSNLVQSEPTVKANALLASGASVDELNAALRGRLTPEDFGVRFRDRVRLGLPARRAARRQLDQLGLPGDDDTVEALSRSYLSVESDQLVLAPPTVEAVLRAARDVGVRAEPTVVYVADSLSHEGKTLWYPIVAGLNPAAAPPLGPFLPGGVSELRDNEVVLVEWQDAKRDADHLPLNDLPPGSKLRMAYFNPEVEGEGKIEMAELTLRGYVRIDGSVELPEAAQPDTPMPVPRPRLPRFVRAANDPELTPSIRGMTDEDARLGNWNRPPMLPQKIVQERVPDKNPRAKFFDQFKATPLAYVNLATAQRLFASRYGSVTSVRVAPGEDEGSRGLKNRLRPAVLNHLDPEAAGLTFSPVRERLLGASRGGNDFGMLFLSFSCFLIAAALMLVGLLFRLSLDRRAKEIGLLLAAGYRIRTMRRMLLAEGLLLAVAGSLIGLAVAVEYNRLLLRVLLALWPDPEVSAFLQPHAEPLSFAVGFGLTLVMALGALWLGVRGLVKVAPPALLRGETTVPAPVTQAWDLAGHRRFAQWGILASLVVGVVLLLSGRYVANPDYQAMTFFAGGFLLLTAGLTAVWVWMRRARHAEVNGRGLPALMQLGARNAARNPTRSLLTAALLAAAAFLLVAVESFRRQPEADFLNEKGGSGGFNLIAETDVPLFEPLDRKVSLEGSTVVPLRLRDGDDASCMNLYRATRPRVLAVPNSLIDRGGFKFYETEASTSEEKANPWLLLRREPTEGAVPVFVENNTAVWMLKTGVGGEVTVPNDAGQPVRCRIVGTLVDSPFQSELITSDDHFKQAFPNDTGYRTFLIRTPPGKEEEVGQAIQAAYRANGLIATPTRDRVATYQAVVGAYLSTFQLLGGFGLLLGVLGLAVVVLRGVWERLGELALLRAVGYRTRALQLLVLAENALLLVVGLGSGILAALVSVAPHVLEGAAVPWAELLGMLGLVFLVGLGVASAATAGILRVPVIPALRRE
jgi:ABC-type lipoprotein release transport system permease subunit